MYICTFEHLCCFHLFAIMETCLMKECRLSHWRVVGWLSITFQLYWMMEKLQTAGGSPVSCSHMPSIFLQSSYVFCEGDIKPYFLRQDLRNVNDSRGTHIVRVWLQSHSSWLLDCLVLSHPCRHPDGSLAWHIPHSQCNPPTPLPNHTLHFYDWK